MKQCLSIERATRFEGGGPGPGWAGPLGKSCTVQQGHRASYMSGWGKLQKMGRQARGRRNHE